MSDIHTYLNILMDSLDNKKELLKKIYEVTKEQAAYVNEETFELDKFSSYMDEKQAHIDAIELIDSGFQSTFDRIAEELEHHAEPYKNTIILLKEKITAVSDIGINIQVLEEKNKAKIEEHFSRKKKRIKSFKKSKATASNYYKNMNNTFKEQSFFLDQKK
ncbi:flagellar export chaperone FlgN [Vallitalea pronyensis]|uniref:Flagellar export chaperone FlgN n=1 Tax=Vallitalea pronyensis TaxID=1348613 RepID=A0A8J8SFD3_9FIRM|nr:flagellar export chaperone FlgN [Vallitalea pronyensis]QUI21461.1 flagellar export chaperone FlgN [Vallitalea pronyensis]